VAYERRQQLRERRKDRRSAAAMNLRPGAPEFRPASGATLGNACVWCGEPSCNDGSNGRACTYDSEHAIAARPAATDRHEGSGEESSSSSSAPITDVGDTPGQVDVHVSEPPFRNDK
jgi:hypothetical protein